MDEYLKFLETKKTTVAQSGFDVDVVNISDTLFPFQKYCVRRALVSGRFALFEDCGLGKTIQQLEWSRHVSEHTDRPVLILAPLGVISQTIEEGVKFGYKVDEIESTDVKIGLPPEYTSPTMTTSTTFMPSCLVALCLMNPRFSKISRAKPVTN